MLGLMKFHCGGEVYCVLNAALFCSTNISTFLWLLIRIIVQTWGHVGMLFLIGATRT